MNDANMTEAGEEDARQIIDLFKRAKTLSEFNSGTYTGVSLYALTLWVKYLPDSSIMKHWGPVMIQETWKAVSELWHADLKNMAGPWDRAYGFDMKRYFSLMSLWLWILVDKEGAGLISKARTPPPSGSMPAKLSQPQILSHSADFTYAPLFAVLAEFHKGLVPMDVIPKLSAFPGEHVFSSSTFSPPWDLYPRNITTWLAPRISIGAESFNETVVGGPSENPLQFNPAVVQWDTGDGGIGFISVSLSPSCPLEPYVSHAAASISFVKPDG